MRALILTAIASASVSYSAVASQICASASLVPDTTPKAQFEIKDDGTVCDKQTNLMWQRCSFGQIYNNDSGSCDNVAQELSWQQALQTANAQEFAGYSDWHLPNVKELASIVEHRCVKPAINEEVFLATLEKNYWSSTTVEGTPGNAWLFSFGDGKVSNVFSKNSTAYVRLVRYAFCE
ncbi:DUF1566 domain-containing protein [Pseudoalteromonas rubra]|uniref:Adhesin n=1 Tax=Pseudoalteromonas rubra TaxID=43658 RepID=A0A5S3X245_9GAMM|nr:DUF1566 domain-containing protein [Pseudoalteromonas rubra]TMP37751.1 adhesin [Pseudoalteromonas rubra]